MRRVLSYEIGIALGLNDGPHFVTLGQIQIAIIFQVVLMHENGLLIGRSLPPRIPIAVRLTIYLQR